LHQNHSFSTSALLLLSIAPLPQHSKATPLLLHFLYAAMMIHLAATAFRLFIIVFVCHFGNMPSPGSFLLQKRCCESCCKSCCKRLGLHTIGKQQAK